MKKIMALLSCACLLCGVIPAVSAEEIISENEEVRRMIASYTGEWNDTAYEGLITQRVPHTALLGNGDVGVASGGDDYSKNFYLSKGDFWAYKDGPKAIGGVILRSQREVVSGKISLAKGATATASSVLGSFTPERVVSGNAANGYEGWVSQIGNPQWLRLDLGQVKRFDRVVVSHASSAGVKTHAEDTKAFSVSVSNNGSDWTVIYETQNNDSAITEIALDSMVSARYLRLDVAKGTQETTSDTINNPRARIVQIELFDSTRPIEASGPTPTSYFHEEQDILNAAIRTEMELDDVPVAMDTRLMEGDNLLVTKLTSLGQTDAQLIARLWAKSDNGDMRQTSAAANGRVTVTRSVPKSNAGDPDSFTTAVAASTRIVGADAVATMNNNSTADLAFTLKAGQTVYVVTAVGGGGQTYDYQNRLTGEDPSAQAAALLTKADTSDKIAALDEIRAAWWADYWSASSIRLDTADERLALLQKYYYNAQYELGCNIRVGKVPPGLYGLWHTTDNPSWKSDYHLNYNFIASFYGVAAANRPEQLLPAIGAIFDYTDSGKADAETLRKFAVEKNNEAVQAFVQSKFDDGTFDPATGIEGGLLYPVGIGPWGMKLDSAYHNQTFNAPFSAYPLARYYDYTGDRDFLENTFYPYLKRVLTFLRAWVVKNDAGQYDIYAGYNEGSWAVNSVGEQTMYRLCLNYAIMASETLGVDEDLRADWIDLRDNMAPYATMTVGGQDVYAMAEKIYTNGEWRDWSNPPDRLNLEPIFPGLDFGYYSTDEELRRMQNTVAYTDNTNQWNGINTFPEIFTQALLVRYDPSRVVDKLAANITRMIQQNGMIDDTVHGVEKAGATEAIHSMLLQTDKGVIKTFPAWIRERDASFTDLRAPGGFLLSGSYSGQKRETQTLTVTSLNGQTATIASPWTDAVITDSAGRTVKATAGSAPNHPEELTYTFDTTAGETYTFAKGERAKRVDKAALQVAVEQMSADRWSAEAFSATSIDTYSRALAEANACLTDAEATQGQVDDALASLHQAATALEPNGVVVARFSAAEKTYSTDNTGGRSGIINIGWNNTDNGPADLSGYDPDALSLRLDLALTKSGTTQSDSELFNTGVIKLRSVDDNGENNVGWPVHGRGLITGDNQINILLSEKTSSATGSIDWSRIDRLNMYIDSLSNKTGVFTMDISFAAIIDNTAARAKKELLALRQAPADTARCADEAIDAYTRAMTAATEILNDPSAELSAVTAATDALQAARDGLIPTAALGDVDASGFVNAADALMALQAATDKIALNATQTAAADVDGNGVVTAVDALMILQYATDKILSFQ